MNQAHTEAFEKILCDVLEQMAFMFARRLEDGEEMPAPSDPIEVSMDFNGALQGRLAIATSRTLCDVLAVNVLGIEPDEMPEGVDPSDTLKELLNVICGHVLTHVAGEQPRFDMTPPVLSPLDGLQWQSLFEGGDALPFIVEDLPLLMALEVREG